MYHPDGAAGFNGGDLGWSLQDKELLKSQAITFNTYAKIARITALTVLTALAAFYVKNTLTAGSLPSAKKPMLITLAALLAVFPGILDFLPPPPDGEDSYPADFQFVAWLSSPQSRNDPALYSGAFIPLCKPYDDWKAFAAGGGVGNSDPSSGARLWSPIPFVNAMISNPAKLMGLPEGTSRAAASSRVCQALRKAPWSIRRLVLLVPMYMFLQTHVVEPAFKYYTSTDIKGALRNAYTAIVPLDGARDTAVDVTDHIVNYHGFIMNPKGKGKYAPLMRGLCGAIDRFPGFQAHTWGEDNRPRFLEKYACEAAPPEPRDAADPSAAGPSGVTSSPSGRGQASAGSSARTTVSPGNPGGPKAPRYVDAARGRVVPTALFHTPGPSSAATLPRPTPGPGEPAPQPGMAPAPPPYGYGFPPPTPGFHPGYPQPPPYAYPPYPYPGYPWPPQTHQTQAPPGHQPSP